jgi:hypothetical protein
VFLNVPYDEHYQPLFVALVGELAALGCEPTCALELADAGQGRLDRILDLVASCELSIHDLSRVQVSGRLRLPRFNMPFELGICCAVARLRGTHRYYVFEERPYRLQSLSDLGGYDPQVHGGTQLGIVRSLLNCLATAEGTPPIEAILSLVRRLGAAARSLAAQHGSPSVFQPHLFRQVAATAARFAQSEDLIR